MHSAHVNIDRVEQQGRAVWIRVQPTLERDLLEMLGPARARLDLRLVEIFKIRLLPVVRFRADSGNVESMRGFHVRRVIETTDERICRDIYRALDITVTSQRKIRKPAFAGSHPKLHRATRRCHRQIEGMFEFDLLSLRESKFTSDVGKGLLRKHDRAGSDGANAARKLNVFDCFREALQPAAILLEKSQARPVDLAVNQQPNQTLMAENRGERKLALRTLEGRGCL